MTAGLREGADIFADPHYRARQTIIEVPSKVGPLAQPAGHPATLRTPGRVTHAGPPLGQHTDESSRAFSPCRPRRSRR